MAYEQRDNSGSLFVNDKKTTDKHPGWKGSAKVDGTDYWVSIWVKTTKDGNKWLSLSLDRKEQQARKPKPAKEEKAESADDFFEDDIPF